VVEGVSRGSWHIVAGLLRIVNRMEGTLPRSSPQIRQVRRFCFHLQGVLIRHYSSVAEAHTRPPQSGVRCAAHIGLQYHFPKVHISSGSILTSCSYIHGLCSIESLCLSKIVAPLVRQQSDVTDALITRHGKITIEVRMPESPEPDAGTFEAQFLR